MAVLQHIYGRDGQDGDGQYGEGRDGAVHDRKDLAADLMAVLTDPVVVIDAQGRIVFSNPAAELFFNISDRILQTRLFADVVGDAHVVTEAVQKAQNCILHDLSIAGKSVARAAVVPLSLAGHVAVIIYGDSYTAKTGWLARVRAGIKPAQHLARLMAHEVKNPLAGIRGAAQLLAKSKLEPDDRELAELIASEAQRISGLIDRVNIFDDAREEFTSLNIHDVLDHIRKMAKASFNLDTVVLYDPSLPEIRADREKLVQVFLNLLKNAGEAGATKVGVRSYYDSQPAIHPETLQKLPICIAIEDNGAGVPQHVQPHIFEPYVTTKSDGDGLGMAVVSKIVDDHGGLVGFTSVAGRTVFTLSFPKGESA